MRDGTILDGRYRIERKLAEGGFGAIYQATDLVMNRAVALKVLHQELADDPDVVERFRREAGALALLRDPHTITMYDVGTSADGTRYIVMELLRGQSLHDVFVAHGRLPWRRVAAIARGVCSSLREAHTVGIIHRDLKPANIHLEQHALESDFVKVLDFGIAKSIEGSDIIRRDLTMAGQMIGTFEYMPPEQLVGGSCTGRSDVFTLAVVIYEMITGERPYGCDARGPASMLMAIFGTTPLPLASRAQVPAELDAVVMRALAREPEDRLDVADFDDALAHILEADHDARRQIEMFGDTITQNVEEPPVVARSASADFSIRFGRAPSRDAANASANDAAHATSASSENAHARGSVMSFDDDARFDDLASTDEASPPGNSRGASLALGSERSLNPGVSSGAADDRATAHLDRNADDVDGDADDGAFEREDDPTWVGPVPDAAMSTSTILGVAPFPREPSVPRTERVTHRKVVRVTPIGLPPPPAKSARDAARVTPSEPVRRVAADNEISRVTPAGGSPRAPSSEPAREVSRVTPSRGLPRAPSPQKTVSSSPCARDLAPAQTYVPMPPVVAAPPSNAQRRAVQRPDTKQFAVGSSTEIAPAPGSSPDIALGPFVFDSEDFSYIGDRPLQPSDFDATPTPSERALPPYLAPIPATIKRVPPPPARMPTGTSPIVNEHKLPAAPGRGLTIAKLAVIAAVLFGAGFAAVFLIAG